MSADPVDPAATPRRPAGWFIYLIAGWVACAAAGVLLDKRMEANLLPYRWGPKARVPFQELRGDDAAEAKAQIETTTLQGGAVAVGVLAGALALALCLVDAAALRRPAAFALVPLGAVIGAAAGAGGGYLGMRLHMRFEAASSMVPTLTEAIMIQVAAWVCAGLGIAVAVWLGSWGRRSFLDTVIGGVFAGALVGVLYPPLASMLFPNGNTDRLFPDSGYFPAESASGYSGAFLFWAMFTGTLFAAVLGAVGKRKVAAPAPAVVGP